jgi:hypothetical protein
MSTALATQAVNPERRTQVTIPLSADPWPVVIEWARINKFNPRPGNPNPNVREYQRGSGFFQAPTKIEFVVENNVLVVTAWIAINLFARISALFMLPAEMHIRSGGFRAVVPRSSARKLVNQLLTTLQAPPIP